MAYVIPRWPMMIRIMDPVMPNFDKLFDEFWDSWETPLYSVPEVPVMQMHKEDGKLIVEVELPGIRPEEIDIEVRDDIMTIKAERHEEDGENGCSVYHKYYRFVPLPEKVDSEKASATFENGLLEIRLPQPAELETKHIEVKALKEPGKKAAAKGSNAKTTVQAKAKKTMSKTKN